MIFKYKDIWTRKNERREGEESPIGLILCSEGNTEHIEYLMLEEDSPIKVHSIIQNCRTRSFFQKNCSELSLLQRSGIRRSCLTRKTTNDDIIASAHSTSGPNCGCAFEDYSPHFSLSMVVGGILFSFIKGTKPLSLCQSICSSVFV